MYRSILSAGACLLALTAAGPALADDHESNASAIVAPEIEFTEWTLDNGLRVIAMPDDTTSTVYTSLWYDVGGKHDPEGRAGFAHMFEHILSRKTQNMPYNLIYSLTADVGGTRNASTNHDRTNYYEIVPAEYLETMLWTHKERMALPVVDQEVFESERGVVKEEFRQRVASQPYGPLVRQVLAENAFDVLPQRRPVIGDIEALDSAELDDARAFHQAFYGPDTATLIVAGNFEIGQLRSLVDKYFADIPRRANPVSTAIEASDYERTAPRTVNATAPNVPLPVTGSLWKLPPAGNPDSAAINLLDSILGSGQSNRLQDALVRSGKAVDKAQIANIGENGGYFATLGFVSPAGDLDEVDTIIATELQRIRDEGVTQAELDEAKNEIFAARLNSRQTARGRASELGEALYRTNGNASAADQFLTLTAAVTTGDIQRVARKYLDPQKRVAIRYSAGPSDPASYANPVPMPEFRTLPAATGEPLSVLPEAEREPIPGPGVAPEVAAPDIAQTTLSNGATVVAAKTGDTPIVTLTAVFPGGTITETRERAGLSALAAALADQGTSTMDAPTLAAAFESLGASLSVSPDDEGTLVSVNAPVATIEEAGKLWVQVLRDANYPADQVALQKNRILENVKALRSNASALGGAVSPPILYGDAPYGIAGDEETIARITPEDLAAYREKWWRPDTMQLVVSGGLETDAAIDLANQLLGDWQAAGEAPSLPDQRAGMAATPRTIVIDLPDAGQASITAAMRAPERSSADYYPLAIANAILGGGSSGRLFEEVRTKRSLSYGAYSGQPGRADEGYLTASAQTKNDTVDEVVQVFLDEFDRLGSEAIAADLVNARRLYLTGSNERRIETSGGFNSVIASLLLRGLPPEEASLYAQRLSEVTPEAAQATAARYVNADAATLIIVGDAQFFLEDLRKIRPDVTVLKAAEIDFSDPLGELGE